MVSDNSRLLFSCLGQLIQNGLPTLSEESRWGLKCRSPGRKRCLDLTCFSFHHLSLPWFLPLGGKLSGCLHLVCPRLVSWEGEGGALNRALPGQRPPHCFVDSRQHGLSSPGESDLTPPGHFLLCPSGIIELDSLGQSACTPAWHLLRSWRPAGVDCACHQALVLTVFAPLCAHSLPLLLLCLVSVLSLGPPL